MSEPHDTVTVSWPEIPGALGYRLYAGGGERPRRGWRRLLAHLLRRSLYESYPPTLVATLGLCPQCQVRQTCTERHSHGLVRIEPFAEAKP